MRYRPLGTNCWTHQFVAPTRAMAEELCSRYAPKARKSGSVKTKSVITQLSPRKFAVELKVSHTACNKGNQYSDAKNFAGGVLKRLPKCKFVGMTFQGWRAVGIK